MVLRTIQEGRAGRRADPRRRSVADPPARAALAAAAAPTRVGLVVERARRPGELDGFQWYCESCGAAAVRGVLRADGHREAVSAGVRAFLREPRAAHLQPLRHGDGALLRCTRRVAIERPRGRSRPGARPLDLARRSGFRGTAAAPLRRPARQLAALRGAGLPSRLGRARRELQLRGHHADPPLQRHAYRVRRPPDARAPRRLARRTRQAAAGAAAVGQPARPPRRARAPTPRRRRATGSSRARARSRPLARAARHSCRARSSSARCPTTPTSATRDYTRGRHRRTCRAGGQLLVSRGIEHLVVDVPSIDRAHDGAGSPRTVFSSACRPAAVQLAAATRPTPPSPSSPTSPTRSPTAAYLLELQVPALGGDAVPSRPLLYPAHGPNT